jgi:RecA-family ATPase
MTVEAQSTAAKFIIDVFAPSTGNPVYLCSLKNRDAPNNEPGERHVATRNIADIDAFIHKWDRKHRGLYFCVSTLANGATRRAKTTTAELTGLHADIDFKNVEQTPDQVRQILRELFLLPSKIIHSGNGLHCYWHFREALPATAESIASVEKMLRQLCNHLGGDPQVCEIARLMRLPGTHNTKDDAWTEVKVIYETATRYDPGELAEWLADVSPVIIRKSASSSGSGNGDSSHDNPFAAFGEQAKPPIDVETRLATMRHQGAGDSSIHATQLQVSASLLSQGWPVDEIVQILLNATRAAAGETGKAWDWTREEHDICRMCSDWLTKHPDIVTPQEQQEQPEQPEQPQPPRILATAHEWRDALQIPRRDFLFRRHYIRGFVSATIAPGGIGKSSQALVETIAMVTAKAFLDETPTSGALRVWYYGEDPQDELDRRIAAICQHYGIQKDDLGDRLFRNSMHDLQLKRFATQGKSGSTIIFDKTLEQDIRHTIHELKLDVVIFDPMIALHSAIENDNVAMDQIARKLGAIAAETDSAIELVHHARKPSGGQTEMTVDDGRGARSVIDATRSARILNRMSAKEAEDAGITAKDRPRYFRADRGKANMAPPESATWALIVSIILPNTDNVGVVTPWTYPNPLDGVAATDVDWVRNLVRTNPNLGRHSLSKSWIGIELAKHLGLDPSSKAHRAKLKKILKTWFDNGVLAETEREDPETRHKRKFVTLGDWNEAPGNDATN